MKLQSWKRWLTRLTSAWTVRTSQRRPRHCGQFGLRHRFLAAEPLEDRQLLAVLTLTPVADNTLYESPTGALSNGVGQHFYAGRTLEGSNSNRRGLMKFDVSAIPAGATIDSVTLTMNMSRSRNATAYNIEIHNAQTAWGEGTSNAGPTEGNGAASTTGDATWVHTFFNSQNWTTPGGDFAATASATASVTGLGSYQWTGAGLAADIQQWVNNGATNLGWVVTGDTTTGGSVKQFDTRENSTAANRPQLVINYTPAPLAIPGTAGNDVATIQFTSANNYDVTINGESASYTTAQFSLINFDGQGGNDTLLFYGPTGAETAALSATAATINGSGFTVSASNVEFKYLFGGANDSATFTDTAAADQFYQLPAFSIMLDGPVSYFNEIIGYGTSTGNSTTGVDLLFTYGTGGSDTYTATTTASTMTSAGLSLVGNGFDQVFAFGQGGTDTATFTGSAGDDAYYGLDGYSVVTSGAFLQYLVSFAQVTANGNGGADVALMFDSPGNDTLTGNPTSTSVVGPTLNNTAAGFDQVFVLATLGGNDTANLDGSAADDLFSGNAFDAAIFRPSDYLVQVYGFELVNAVLTGAGTDLAELIDGAGNDVLSASAGTAEITYAAGNRIRTTGFDFVFAKSQNGGVNTKQVVDPLTFALNFVGEWV